MVVVVLLDISVPITATVAISTTCDTVIMVEVVRVHVSKIAVVVIMSET